MNYNRVLIDTNVCLDAILLRFPFANAALKLLEASEQGRITGFVAAHSFDTLFYILTQVTTKQKTYDAIEALVESVQIAPVDQKMIKTAIKEKWPDFEDAIHHQSALEAGCKAIITRNTKDFKRAQVAVITPDDFLEQLE